jgi:hypothetical protein
LSRRDERGQALVLMVGAGLVLLLSVGVLAALGQALLGRGRAQRAADLGAVSAARSMRDDFWRLFEPATLTGSRVNPRHLSKDGYLARARAAGLEAVRLNGADGGAAEVDFPDRTSFAPTRVHLVVRDTANVRTLPTGRAASVPIRASAEAELAGSVGGTTLPNTAEGGGYS